MNFKTKNGTNIYYDFFPTFNPNTRTIVILHGWDGLILWPQFISRYLLNKYQIIFIHLPGFGKSSMPIDYQRYDSFTYAEEINELLDYLGLQNFVIVGHSLGGKIAVILNAIYKKGSKLILISAACFRRFDISVWLKNKILHFMKNFKSLCKIDENHWLYKIVFNYFASEDYKAAGRKHRRILQNVIHNDVRHLLPLISVPTLIIWGEKDTHTPLIDAVEMHKLIPNSELKIVKDMNHFIMVLEPDILNKLIEDFLYEN